MSLSANHSFQPPGSVIVHPHPLIESASLRIGAAGTDGAKALGVLPPPPIAETALDALTPLPLVPEMGEDSAVISIDLKAGAPVDSVSPETPIRLSAGVAVVPGDTLLLIGFDTASGLYLPLGTGTGSDAGVDLAITHLPAQQANAPGGKSIGGALSMMVYKLAGDKIGMENPFPLLRPCRALPGPQRKFETQYETLSTQALRERVAAAQRILVFAHGFTGDTRTMITVAPGLKRFAPALPDYDLLLAFDYENINTRIQDSAQALKERLAEIGLAAGHSKSVHLVSHSLGTQISRWFIEREGGAKVVQKAVLVGPPNAGTPLAALQEVLTFAIGLGLNGLLSVVAPWAALVWAVRAVSAVVAGFEKVDNTLDQLKPNSDFYKDLNRSDDPQIPYHIIIGDTAKIKPKPMNPDDHVGALFKQVFSTSTRNRLMSLAFANQPNDIAISLTSADHLAKLMPARSPLPVVTTVACDHVSYFTDPEGIRAIATALAA